MIDEQEFTPAYSGENDPSAAEGQDLSASEREEAYRFFRDNPEELEALVNVAQRAYSGEAEPRHEGVSGQQDADPKPTLEDCGWDHETYTDQLTDWKLRQTVGALRSEYTPVVQAQSAAMAAQHFGDEIGVDDVGREFLKEQFTMLPPQVLGSLSPEAKRVFALAAKGFAAESQGHTNGRVMHAEPVAGVGPMRVQLADGVRQGELNAYLSITGKSLNKETVKELRAAGYLK